MEPTYAVTTLAQAIADADEAAARWGGEWGVTVHPTKPNRYTRGMVGNLTGEVLYAVRIGLDGRVTNKVTRWVPTYVNRHGMRTLMRAAQGRDTFATMQEAQQWLNAVLQGTSTATIAQLWGNEPRFAVRPCMCWASSFDPCGVWFDD